MTERVNQMRSLILDRSYRESRCHSDWDISSQVAQRDGMDAAAAYLLAFLQQEQPKLLGEHDLFGFHRHMANYPTCTMPDGTPFHDRISNIAPCYTLVIDRGVLAVIADIDSRQANPFLTSARTQLSAMLRVSEQYKLLAQAQGNRTLYEALCQVPAKPPRSLYEACLFQKILVYTLRCARHSHLPLGRFDQYMYPYYLADKARGMTDDALLEILELYFLDMNADADLYLGEQQGDNGQSMVLGGFDLDGTDRFNPLSRLCLEASRELCVIDPKINIRVGKATPHEIYELGTELTKLGLGFPQYCNDDVIIPGLIKLGYRPEDAADYAVAACWEPIIPGHGADIPNCRRMAFPIILSEIMQTDFLACETFAQLMAAMERNIAEHCRQIRERYNSPQLYYFRRPISPSPLMSLMLHGCLEQGKDVSEFACRYYNSGAFAAGISTAADSLAAIKKLVYDEKTVSRQTLLDALNADFEGYTQLRNQLLDCPKMGNDDPYVDSIAAAIMDMYVATHNGKPNGVGGVWRAGTGSAQFYALSGMDCPATADGRKSGQPFGCSFSPSPQAKVAGPLSVIRSFTKRDLSDLINGGPLTMELHSNVFRNADAQQKVARLVQLFVLSGGHQLQLNMLNRQQLLDALQNPQAHRNLVVRVWGWSGYFLELDKPFQDHILMRTNFTL